MIQSPLVIKENKGESEAVESKDSRRCRRIRKDLECRFRRTEEKKFRKTISTSNTGECLRKLTNQRRRIWYVDGTTEEWIEKPIQRIGEAWELQRRTDVQKLRISRIMFGSDNGGIYSIMNHLAAQTIRLDAIWLSVHCCARPLCRWCNS
jgi:hypothetical protein